MANETTTETTLKTIAIPHDAAKEPITIRVPAPLRDAWLAFVGKHGGDESAVMTPLICQVLQVKLPTGYMVTSGKRRLTDDQKAYNSMTQLIAGKASSVKRDYALSHNGNLPTEAEYVRQLLWNISKATASNAKLNKELARLVISETYPDGWEAGQTMFADDVKRATGVAIAS
jgi:hypothetical protein